MVVTKYSQSKEQDLAIFCPQNVISKCLKIVKSVVEIVKETLLFQKKNFVAYYAI